MRQTLTVVVGQTLRGATLPDGSPAFAVAVDNPSGYWYQLYPGGSTIAPNTQRAIVEVPGGAPSIDLVALANGPAGQPSLVQGGNLTVTLFDRTEAPGGDAGAQVIAPVAGNLRYIGALPYAGVGTFDLPITLLGNERSILAFIRAGGGSSSIIAVIGTQSDNLRTFEDLIAFRSNDPGVAVGYANPAISLAWRVHISSSAAAENGTVYVFTDTALPERALTTFNAPLPVQTVVPYNGVSLATSGFPQRIGAKAPYDSTILSAPAVNVQAIVTFPATAGVSWVIDFATFALYSIPGGAGGVAVQIIDVAGAGTLYQTTLVIPAAAGSIDRLTIGPGLGFQGQVGDAVTVGFSAAGGANTQERVSAGAYMG